MWTRPSNEKRSVRLKIERSAHHFPSHQPGTQFAIQTWQAEGVAPERHLLFLHGALAHGSRHEEMFEWFIRRNEGRLAIFAMDFVGHGISSGTRAYVKSFRHWVEDALSACEFVSSKPTVLMGHSMGGLVVLKAILEHEQRIPEKLGPVVLSNPCVRPVQVVDFPQVERAFNAVADYLPLFRYPRVHKGSDVANDSAAANDFETDPLVPKFITAQMAREIWYASEEVRPLSYFIKRPVLFLLSDQDVVVDKEAALLFSRGIDKKWVKVLEYNHVKHELLHESIRQQVWLDVAQWLEAL
jgi:acylglycerol lipase